MLRRMTVMLLCVLLALCAAGCGGVPEEKLARAGEDCTALVEEYNALAKTLGESALAADEDYTAALDELRTPIAPSSPVCARMWRQRMRGWRRPSPCWRPRLSSPRRS